MSTIVLGLDIGGANLKAATSDGRTASVPFPLWKRHLELPQALGQLVEQFPDVEELAITMTGELCDCYETKREGVNHIVTSVMNVSRSRPIRVWSTQQRFLNTNEAKENYLAVAAANWHALAMYVGGYKPSGNMILVDVGSTTTDIIPILNGKPVSRGMTDSERLAFGELVYIGVRRTPAMIFLRFAGAAELFATTHDAHLLLGLAPEEPNNCETADGRPATMYNAHARMSRMVCGDPELTELRTTRSLAEGILEQHREHIISGVSNTISRLGDLLKLSSRKVPYTLVLSGSGETFLKRIPFRYFATEECERDTFLLSDKLGPQLSEVAPAYAVARLAAERRS